MNVGPNPFNILQFMKEVKVVWSQCDVDQLMQGHDLSKGIFNNVRDDLYYMGISSTTV